MPATAKEPKHVATLHRFNAKVLVSSDGCWNWRGAIEKNGYGRFAFNGRMRWAHRVAYELLVGPIPSGKELDHLCRNTRCVNPAHLEAVTHKENMARSPIGAPAMHRRKAHCPQGHPYSGDNLIVYRQMRYCRKCQQEHKRANKQKLKALRNA